MKVTALYRLKNKLHSKNPARRTLRPYTCMICVEYRSVQYVPVDCTAYNGTSAALDLITETNVDVLVGPRCSVGECMHI